MKSKPVRIYTLGIALLFCGYVWCAWNGYRILGDDNETSQRRGRVGGHYFYHK